MIALLVLMDNCFVCDKSVHKVRDFPNLKGKDKGSGKSQASCSNVDALKKNHFYALLSNVLGYGDSHLHCTSIYRLGLLVKTYDKFNVKYVPCYMKWSYGCIW